MIVISGWMTTNQNDICNNYIISPVVGNSGSWFAQLTTANFLVWGLNPSQPHPEPCTAIEAVARCFLNSSNEPKLWIKALFKSSKYIKYFYINKIITKFKSNNKVNQKKQKK